MNYKVRPWILKHHTIGKHLYLRVSICSHPVDIPVEETIVHACFNNVPQLEISDMSLFSSLATLIQLTGHTWHPGNGAFPWIAELSSEQKLVVIAPWRFWNTNPSVISYLIQLHFHSCVSPREVIKVLAIFLCFSARFSYALLCWALREGQWSTVTNTSHLPCAKIE